MDNIESLLEKVNLNFIEINNEFEKLFPDKLFEDYEKELQRLKESLEIANSRIKQKLSNTIDNIELICSLLKQKKEIKNLKRQNELIFNYVFHVKQMRDYLEIMKKDLDNPFKKEIIQNLNETLEIFYTVHNLFKESIHFYNRCFENKLLTIEEAQKQVQEFSLQYF